MRSLFFLLAAGLSIVTAYAQPSRQFGVNLFRDTSRHFIGTMNNTDVIFKRDGIRSGLLNEENTSFGYGAMSNTGRNGNTAIGVYALFHNTNAYGNTALGGHALFNNKTGVFNSVAGGFGLFGNETGSFNTSVGYMADVTASNYDNVTLIGAYAVSTASDQVRIGNTSVTSIGGYASWSSFADARFEMNVRENVPGLTFINLLRPVTYQLNLRGINNYLYTKTASGLPVDPHTFMNDEWQVPAKEKAIYTGFIAQEVEAVARKINFTFSGVDTPQNEADVYNIRYAEFVVPLVKAVQELSAKNDALTKEVLAMKKQLEEIRLQLGNHSFSSSRHK